MSPYGKPFLSEEYCMYKVGSKDKGSGPYFYHVESFGVLSKNQMEYSHIQHACVDLKNMTLLSNSVASYDATRKIVVLYPSRLPQLI